MRFHDQVVLFEYSGFPMVGNLRNGFAIGLTSEGARLCDALKTEDVSEDSISDTDAPLFDALLSNGFMDEEAQPKRLKSAYLHVTQRCNLDCKGCYSLDKTRNALEDASTEQMMHAIDELANAGCQTLFISGGEPFLRDDLPELLRHAKDRGIGSITLITNGTCVDARSLADLAGVVDNIAVSIDGYSKDCPAHIRGEQRFDQLIECVKAIQAAGITAHLTPTIHSKNYDDMREYAKLAEDLGVTFNYSLLSCDYGDPDLADLIPNDDDLNAMAENLLEMGSSASFTGTPIGLNLTASRNCGAGTKEISIAADGTVYPCHMMHRPELTLGNVFEGPLEDILANQKNQELSKIGIEGIEGCSTCECGYLCGGGCRARSLYRYGNLDSRDGYCELMRSYYAKLGDVLKAQFAQG